MNTEFEKERSPQALVKASLWLLVPLAIFYLVMAVLYIRGVHGFYAADKRLIGNDFMNWWMAARLTLDGNIMTLFDPQNYFHAQMDVFGPEVEPKVWSYPPHVLPWFLWLGFLSYPAALAAWTFGGFAAYLCAVAWKTDKPWTMALVFALAPSSYIEIINGQTGFFTAACLVGGLRLLDEAPIAAGILFGFLTFKPHFALLVPVVLLAGKYWRALAAAGVTFVFLVGISIAMFGIAPWAAYFDKTFHVQRLILEASYGGNGIYQMMMISPFMAVRMLGGSLSLAYGVNIVIAAIAVKTVFDIFRASSSPALRMAAVLTATFLVSPHMFVYDTPALSAAIGAMIVYAMETDGVSKLRPWHMILFLAAWILPLVAVEFGKVRIPVYPPVVAALLFVQTQWAKSVAAPPARLRS